MLENDLIEASSSEWSSLCVLVPKPDGTYQFCTDFRQVNKVTKSDSYPIPQVDDNCSVLMIRIKFSGHLFSYYTLINFPIDNV